MIGVEDRFGAAEVERVLGALVPGQSDDPVEVGARYGVLGGGNGHLREAIELAQGLFLDRFRHADGIDLRPELLDLLRLLVSLAQLLLDRLQLLAEEILPLVLANLRLHLRLDLRSELEDFELFDQQPVEHVHPGADVEHLENFLLDAGTDGREARSNEIGELAGIGDVPRQRLQIVGEQRRQRHDLLEVALDVALERINLEVILIAQDFVCHGHCSLEVRPRLHDPVETHAGQALHDQPEAPVGELEHLVDVRRRADGIQVVLSGLLDRRFTLREHANHPAGGGSFIDQPDRGLPRNREGHEGIGEKHGVAQRQHRQLTRNRQREFCALVLFGDERLVLIAH